MSEKKKLVPKRRFKEFENADPWEQRKLGKLADFSTGYGYTKSDLKKSGTPIILYGRLYTSYQTIIKKVDTFADVISGAVFSEGGEVILPSSGETSEDIAIAANVDTPGFLLGGGLNIVNPSNKLRSVFLALEISYGHPHIELAKKAQGKSVVHLYNEDLKEVKISFPTIEEQMKISQLFENIDNQITLHQRKLEKLKNLKSAYLSEMFPAEGERKPKRRFAGFTDDWEQRRLGEILQTLPFKAFIKEPEQSGKYKIIQQGTDSIVGYANGVPCIDYIDTVIFGDHTLSLYKPDSPFFLATDGVRIMKGKECIEGFYLMVLLEKYKPQSEGYKRYYSILVDGNCYLTKDTAEQQQISVFYHSLDNLITLHQRKLEKLQNIKKAYLNEMFI